VKDKLAKFSKIYNILNPEQKQAVDTIDGPVMVIAGPGTGKTQILTLRIANIVRLTDTDPDSILALTFTESGVYSMRKRLVETIGAEGYKAGIYTFHGFCNAIIKDNPDEFPRIIGSSSISEIDQIQIMENIIKDLKLKKLKPYGDNFYYLRPIMGVIRKLKMENVEQREFADLISKQKTDFYKIPDLYYTSGRFKGKMKSKYRDLEKKISKNEDLVQIYRAYQEKLSDLKLYDYEDMIVEVINRLEESEDLLLKIQEKYQYILADEHQDANQSQNRLLELLSSFHDNPNIFIVGDEKQAIFRFQGASLDNFLYFKNLYKKVKIIHLRDNYRSTQNILDGAHSLISKSSDHDASLRKNLVSHKPNAQKMGVLSFSSEDFEYLYILKDIEKKIKKGVSPGDIAVLYRDNKDVFPLLKILSKSKVPFVIESSQDVLSDDDMNKFVSLLRAINNFGNDEELAKVLYLDFFKISNLDVYKIISSASRLKKSLFDIIKSQALLKKIELDDTEKITSLYKNMLRWSALAKNMNLVSFFEELVYTSGFLSHLLSNNASLDKLKKLENLFDEAKKLMESRKSANLEYFINYLDILLKYNVVIRTKQEANFIDSIHLMTAHKSKGLEFEHVYVIGAYDGHWGNKRSVNYFHIPLKQFVSDDESGNDDERRLFYVALTRAKKEITVTFSRKGEMGQSRLPLIFIEEIDENLVNQTETSTIEEKQAKDLKIKFESNSKFKTPKKEKLYLNKLFLEQGLSVTALNNYLKCPWNYFFNNLLRLPKAPNKHQLYGIAIHTSFKSMFDSLKEGKKVNKLYLVKVFTQYLNRQPVNEYQFEEMLQKGKYTLSKYYDEYKGVWYTNVINEFNIAGVFIDISKKDKLLLRGKLDKLEILDDGKSVNVVDYKTGKPKSRNVILGKTKSSNGDYFRQLVFYKLLLDKYNSSKFNMVSGEIDFVEPDDKDRFKKEKFNITSEDVSKLGELILGVSNQIMDLSFFDKTCNNVNCSDCKLRNMITW
jgi:DNA helicase-2/ATP-dependent DNA helicase PcrA